MTSFNHAACELSDDDLGHVAGGKDASTSRLWNMLGTLFLGPLVGTAIGQAIGGASNNAQDAA